MTSQSRKQLIETLRADIRRLENNPRASAEVATLQAAVTVLQGGAIPNTVEVPNAGRVTTPAAPSPASLKRAVPVAGHSGDPRLEAMDRQVRAALGQGPTLGTKSVGRWQFAGVDETYDPFAKQNT